MICDPPGIKNGKIRPVADANPEILSRLAQKSEITLFLSRRRPGGVQISPFLPPPHSVGMERERYLRQRKPQLDHINHNMTNNDSFTLARLRIEREGDASGEKRHPGPRKGGLCSKTQHRGRKPGRKESSNTYRCYYSSNPQFPPEHGLFEWTFQLLNLRRSDSSVPA